MSKAKITWLAFLLEGLFLQLWSALVCFIMRFAWSVSFSLLINVSVVPNKFLFPCMHFKKLNLFRFHIFFILFLKKKKKRSQGIISWILLPQFNLILNANRWKYAILILDSQNHALFCFHSYKHYLEKHLKPWSRILYTIRNDTICGIQN